MQPPARRRTRPGVTLLVALSAALTLGAGPACKSKASNQPGTIGPIAGKRVKASKRSLPKPYKLPKKPPAGVHIAAPNNALGSLGALIPGVMQPEQIVYQALSSVAPSAVARAAARHADLKRPLAAVNVKGEDILHVAIDARALKDVAATLKDFPKEGEFGAVKMRAVPAGYRGAPASHNLAWLDKETRTLTIARTERGLATGHELARFYGKNGDVWLAVDSTYSGLGLPDFPFGRIEAKGAGLHDLDITATAHPERGLPKIDQITPGGLTGMLSAPGLAVGGTTRWAGHKKFIKRTVSQINSAVDRAGFMAKMVVGKLAARANTALRMWNGRVFAGVGPGGHLVIGLGADDAEGAKRAVLGVITLGRDNLSMVRSFVKNVPTVNLKKRDGHHLLTLGGVRGMVPPEARSLLDEKGRLRVALAFSKRAGGVMLVVGPSPDSVMTKWLAAVKKATPAGDSASDLFSAAIAVDPADLAALGTGAGAGASAGQPPPVDLKKILGLKATREATRIVVKKDGESYRARVTGPKLRPPPRKNPNAAPRSAKPSKGKAKPKAQPRQKGRPIPARVK